MAVGTGFKIFAIIVGIFFVGFSIANIVYYLKARSAPLNNTQAMSMVVMNVLMLIVAIGLVVWAVVTGMRKQKTISYRSRTEGERPIERASELHERGMLIGDDYPSLRGTLTPPPPPRR